jgi:hypothetical protein
MVHQHILQSITSYSSPINVHDGPPFHVSMLHVQHVVVFMYIERVGLIRIG